MVRMNEGMGKRGITTLMMILEIIIILFAAYSIFSLASKYASSETTNKIIIADDIKMMVDTLLGTPGEAMVQYPGNVSKYTFILSSSSVSVFIKGEGEQKKIVRYFSLPEGYQAFGTVENRDKLCLTKEKKKIILRECVKSTVVTKEDTLTKVVTASGLKGFYGLPLEGDRIVFVVDRSGSMELPAVWSLPEGVTLNKKTIQEIDVAEWQVKKALTELPDGKDFTIIFFADVINDNMIFSKSLVELNAESRAKGSKFVEGWKPFGGTDILKALKLALAYEGVDTIYLISDGSPSVDVTKPEELLTRVRELNTNGAKIHTIGTFVIKSDDSTSTKETKEKGKNLLAKLAAENGGVFVLPEE